jgi:hypothetical protein
MTSDESLLRDLGPCAVCGRPLPLGTLRYCVHCGAEVGGDHRARAAGLPSPWSESPLSGWPAGQFPVPSPSDDVTLQAGPHSGASCYPDAWYPADAAATRPFDVPLPAGAEVSRATVPVDACAPTMEDQLGRFAFSRPSEPQDALAGGIGDQRPVASPDASVWHVQSPLAAADDGGARRFLLPVVAASLALVVVATAGVLWFTSRRSSSMAAGPVTSVAATPSEAAAPDGSKGGLNGAGSAGVTGSRASVPPASSTASSPESSTSGTDVVASLDALLTESVAARGDVAATVSRLQSCQVPATQAGDTFRRASESRNRLATDATVISAAAVSAVPGAGDAVRAFIALQRTSAQADDAFAAWADEVAAAGCTRHAPHTVNWRLANRLSSDASTQKARFVLIWNPLATAQGLTPRTADAI